MKYQALTIAKYTYIEAVRNRLFSLLLIGIVVVFGLVSFIGELSITETRLTQLGFFAFILRFAAVLVTALYVVSSVLREFNDKTINLIIALPVPRYSYFLGKLTGFSMLAVTVSLLVSLPVWIYAEPTQVNLWVLSLTFELLILVTLCLFFIFTLENMPLALTAVVAFYLLSRSIATMILIGESPILESTEFSQQFINFLLQSIAYILPGLDNFTRTEWLVYNTGTLRDLGYTFSQTIIYTGLLSAGALFDLYRKNF